MNILYKRITPCVLALILITGAFFAPLYSHAAEYEGEQAEETIPDGWYEENGGTYYYSGGTYLKGLRLIDDSLYYFSNSGVMQTGFNKIKGNTYYFDINTGQAASGLTKIGGDRYYFDPEAYVMVTGFVNDGNKRYYFLDSGKAAKGMRTISGYRYYFTKSGDMKKGWLKKKGRRYYFKKNGHMAIGKARINGKVHYFNKKGVKKKVTGFLKKLWNKNTSTGFYVTVNKGSRRVTVFKGEKYNWRRAKSYRCSIGAPSTPTPSGTFKVTGKAMHFGEVKGYSCWYATAFIGSSYLMHSVVCYKGTKTPSDGRLGMAISHGCVRMAMSSAKWIYYNVPVGTPVRIH